MAQEPRSIFSDPFAPPPPGPRPFELTPPRPTSLFSDPFGRESERLEDAARRAGTTTPDQAARLLRLQRRTGFPTELIERNLDEIERQTAALDFDVEQFRAESPLLARWLAEHPQHLALAQDDLRPLSAIERTLGVGANVARSFAAGALRFNVGFWGLLQAAGELTGLEPVAQAFRGAGLEARQLSERTRGPQTGAGFVERSIYGGVESMGLSVPALALAVLGGGQAAALSVFGGATGGEAYAQAREQGVSVPEAAVFGLSQGAVEVATERLPVSWLLKDLRRHTGFLRMLVRQGVGEIRGEEIATVLQDLNEWAVLNPQAPFAAYWAERPSAAAQTLIATVVAVGGQTAIASALSRATGVPGSQRVLDELGAAARASKTGQRLPEAVADLVGQMTVDGPLETVYLPVDSFAAYWQERRVDPAQVAERLTGDRTALQAAQQTGEDLAVSMPVYVREIAGTEHNAFFAQEARFAPEAPNAREERALEQQVEAEVQAAAAVPIPEAITAAPVREAVETILAEAEVEPTEAQTYGTIYESVFGTMARAIGVDPLALFQRYPLTVEREAEPAAPGVPTATPATPEGAPELEATLRAAEADITLGVTIGELPAEFIPVGEEPAPPVQARTLTGEEQMLFSARVSLAEDAAKARGEVLTETQRAEIRAQVLEPIAPGAEAAMAAAARGRVRPGERTFQQAGRARITFGRREVRVGLLKTANLTSFLHETGHLVFEVFGDAVTELEGRAAETLTDDQRRLGADYRTLLQALGAPSREGLTDAHHEQFTEWTLTYLEEGKAPSPELRPVFARVRTWLLALYQALRRQRVPLTAEVRAVFDRLFASDVAIEAAAQDAAAQPLFTEESARAAGLSAEDLAAYQATRQAAAERARDAVQSKLLAQLQRERETWWKQERKALREEVAAAIAQEPIYKALTFLQRGTLPDGSPLPAGVDALKLSKKALVAEFGQEVLAQLPRPLVYSAKGGMPASVAADLLGFPSSRALVDALRTAPSFDQAVDAATDARMRERHGDLLLEGRLGEIAQTAVLDAGAEVFAAELTFLERLVTRGGQRVTPTSVRTLRAIADRRIAGMTVREVRPGVFAAAARRAGQRALEAAGRQDVATALEAKRQQVLNAELYRAATSAVEMVEQARADFRRVFARDASLAPRYNLDLVNAARALLGEFYLATREEGTTARSYLERVQAYDPATYADLQAAIDAASEPGRPWRDLTVDEFTAVRDAVLSLWHLARRSNQIKVEEKLQELSAVRGELEARLEAITPRAKRTYTRKVTRWQETKRHLLGFRAALRRVEHWVEGVDGGDPQGAFRRLLFTPIAEAASTYRVAKKATLERYLTIVKGVESSLTTQDIPAPELDYTFTGKAELLHAVLHTGNESNLRKMLLGDHETRPRWGDVNADETLDRSRWDRFVERLWREGTLTKTDYDFVQGVWDLLEEQKPEAQRVHHETYGYFFSEISAQEVRTPFGIYRGGYVPAIYDPFLDDDAARRADKEAIDHTPNSFMFPTTGRGFTIKRVDPYVRPLMLDLRVLPLHLDKVLRFIHLQPVVKDAGRLVINKSFRSTLGKLDPTVAGELLVPWLQRAARQTVDTPAQGWGGRGADRFFRALRRRTGMQIMVANFVNTVQQFTGVGLSAVKVPKSALGRALWRYVRGPRILADTIAEKSAFMRTRTMAQAIEIQATIDDLVLNPSKYEQARAFATRHGYFLQQGTQNIVDLVTWSATYDHQVAEGATDPEAVQRADAVVRMTQGTFNPEDLSAFETGTPLHRVFTMFYSWYNLAANLLGTEFVIATRDMGLKAGAGRLLYIYTFGFLPVAVLSEVIVKLGSGDKWDEDDDGEILDDLLVLFFGAQQRMATAMVPIVGPIVNAGINAFNDKWYDDRMSTSPAVSALESAARAPHSVYKAIVEDGRKKTAIRDTLTTIGLLTGLPVAPLGRPLGYLADVAEGREEPEGPADVARGLVVGR